MQMLLASTVTPVQQVCEQVMRQKVQLRCSHQPDIDAHSMHVCYMLGVSAVDKGMLLCL
jgi:hypothetical protein